MKTLHNDDADLIRDALDWYADHLASVADGLNKAGKEFGVISTQYARKADAAHELRTALRSSVIHTEDAK